MISKEIDEFSQSARIPAGSQGYGDRGICGTIGETDMDFWSGIEGAVGEVIDWFTKPPEPLVLGAELWCPYGSEHSFLILQRDEINIDNLPQANVCDCVKSVNIDDFGECYGGQLCKDKMILAGRWHGDTGSQFRSEVWEKACGTDQFKACDGRKISGFV